MESWSICFPWGVMYIWCMHVFMWVFAYMWNNFFALFYEVRSFIDCLDCVDSTPHTPEIFHLSCQPWIYRCLIPHLALYMDAGDLISLPQLKHFTNWAMFPALAYGFFFCVCETRFFHSVSSKLIHDVAYFNIFKGQIIHCTWTYHIFFIHLSMKTRDSLTF